jgi:TRAP-type C4-dicarboxylate transport system permease large subunit
LLALALERRGLVSWREAAAIRPSRSRAAQGSAFGLVQAIPGLLLIAIIFGGVRSGVFTADGKLVHRGRLRPARDAARLSRPQLERASSHSTLGAVRTTAMVLFVIGCAASFGWLMAYLKVPATITHGCGQRSATSRSSCCC